jgi:hypothetical protein
MDHGGCGVHDVSLACRVIDVGSEPSCPAVHDSLASSLPAAAIRDGQSLSAAGFQPGQGSVTNDLRICASRHCIGGAGQRDYNNQPSMIAHEISQMDYAYANFKRLELIVAEYRRLDATDNND